MARFDDCPYGFEDGFVVSYNAAENRLNVIYEFWNERRGVLTFDGFRALNDNFAIGTTIGSAKQLQTSQLIKTVIGREYEKPPEQTDLNCYILLDADDNIALEIVASSCRFAEQGDV